MYFSGPEKKEKTLQFHLSSPFFSLFANQFDVGLWQRGEGKKSEKERERKKKENTNLT